MVFIGKAQEKKPVFGPSVGGSKPLGPLSVAGAVHGHSEPLLYLLRGPRHGSSFVKFSAYFPITPSSVNGHEYGKRHWLSRGSELRLSTRGS
jgi:hypothetical protein